MSLSILGFLEVSQMRNMLQSWGFALICCTTLSVSASWAAAPPKPIRKAVTFDDVLQLVQSGIDAPTILDNCDTIFTLNALERGKLLKAGATPALVAALEKKRMLI